jgi:hypothetical protein
MFLLFFFFCYFFISAACVCFRLGKEATVESRFDFKANEVYGFLKGSFLGDLVSTTNFCANNWFYLHCCLQEKLVNILRQFWFFVNFWCYPESKSKTGNYLEKYFNCYWFSCQILI